MAISDYRQLQMWKLSGWTLRSGDFGTSATLTKCGTNEDGNVTSRYLLGACLTTDAVASMYVLNGTAFALSLHDIPTGAYNWTFPVAPQSSVGTGITAILDSAVGGTVAFNIFGK